MSFNNKKKQIEPLSHTGLLVLWSYEGFLRSITGVMVAALQIIFSGFDKSLKPI